MAGALNRHLPPAFHPGRRENGERSHQPESGGAGRLRGAVQNQAAHPAEQADEGVLRAAGRPGPARPGPAAPAALPGEESSGRRELGWKVTSTSASGCI